MCEHGVPAADCLVCNDRIPLRCTAVEEVAPDTRQECGERAVTFRDKLFPVCAAHVWVLVDEEVVSEYMECVVDTGYIYAILDDPEVDFVIARVQRNIWPEPSGIEYTTN